MSLDLRACTFIKASKEVTGEYLISELVKAELERARDSGKTFSRHTLRMLPVETTCFAGIDEIAAAAAPLIEKHFKSDDEKVTTFAICFDRRANNSVKRMDVIDAIAKLVKQPNFKVNLSNPDLSIMVEVVKGVACLSIVKDYDGLCKYNLRMVGMTEEERVEAKTMNRGNAGYASKPRTTSNASENEEANEEE